VPKGKDLALVRRDIDIQDRIARGERLADIATRYNLSIGRISQINHTTRDLIADDEKREMLGAKLDYVLNEKLLFLMNQPRQVKISPAGKPVYELDDDGHPDYERPVLDDTLTIEAAKAVTGTIDQIAKLYGLHMRKPRQVDESAEIAEWQVYMQELHAQNQELRQQLAARDDVIEGEIVGEDDSAVPAPG
jgi:hypothetical protein